MVMIPSVTFLLRAGMWCPSSFSQQKYDTVKKCALAARFSCCFFVCLFCGGFLCFFVCLIDFFYFYFFFMQKQLEK